MEDIDRKLTIQFLKTGDVRYQFWRSPKLLKSYLIEYPIEKVCILRPVSGFIVAVDHSGYARLRWLTPNVNSVDYVKVKMLEQIDSKAKKFNYKEQIKIKANSAFGVWIGGPTSGLTINEEKSKATFVEKNGRIIEMNPKTLFEYVFHQHGTLRVDYILEP